MATIYRHEDVPPRRRRVIKGVCVGLAILLVVVGLGGYVVYRHLEGNITSIAIDEQLGDDRPDVEPEAAKALNILLLGSDTREGAGNKIGGETPGLSDTTILLHLSADREWAYGVSLPRDAMVERPECMRKDGEGTDPGGLTMFNAAYAVGGPGCTVKTVEQLTGVRINHYVVVDFNGFKNMVDALGGVQVCVPTAVHDDVGHIDLKAGTYEVTGQEALDYVRIRYAISENGDIGRMKRQQAFLASMSNKAISAGTLINPVRLYSFLDAATKSLTTDFDSLSALSGLANQVKNIGLDNIAFLTVPFEPYPADKNRLQWSAAADKLWNRLQMDKPLTPGQSESVTTAADEPSGSPSDTPSGTASPSAKPSKSAEAIEAARANGLCA